MEPRYDKVPNCVRYNGVSFITNPRSQLQSHDDIFSLCQRIFGLLDCVRGILDWVLHVWALFHAIYWKFGRAEEYQIVCYSGDFVIKAFVISDFHCTSTEGLTSTAILLKIKKT